MELTNPNDYRIHCKIRCERELVYAPYLLFKKYSVAFTSGNTTIENQNMLQGL